MQALIGYFNLGYPLLLNSEQNKMASHFALFTKADISYTSKATSTDNVKTVPVLLLLRICAAHLGSSF